MRNFFQVPHSSERCKVTNFFASSQIFRRFSRYVLLFSFVLHHFFKSGSFIMLWLTWHNNCKISVLTGNNICIKTLMTNAIITAYAIMHPDCSEMAIRQQSDIEICLHRSQTYHFGFPNSPFCNTKWHVLVIRWLLMLYRDDARGDVVWIIFTSHCRFYVVHAISSTKHLLEVIKA